MLAAAAAAVSFAAQYQLVFDAKGIRWASVLEAGIPDVGSMVFAALGIALALKGKLALRARSGNLACVGLSLTMNLIAAAAGWRGVAIWVMPSAVYAFASDTLIGVIRAHVLASQGRDDSEKTALGALGTVLLWVLRLALAAPSTLKGFRRWVVESSPVAPGVAPAAITAANESAAKAIEAAHVTAGQQIAEAAQARDEAVSRAQDAERRAAEAQRAAATVQAELQRAGQDFAQLASALQRAEDERSRLAGTAQELQTALAGQRAEAAASARAAEAARGEAQRIREDAARQVVQMREDFIRERAEYRDSLAGMREATQALDADRRQARQERDRPADRAGGASAARRAVKSRAKDTAGPRAVGRGPSPRRPGSWPWSPSGTATRRHRPGKVGGICSGPGARGRSQRRRRPVGSAAARPRCPGRCVMTHLIAWRSCSSAAGGTAAGCKWRIAPARAGCRFLCRWGRGVPRVAAWSVAAHPARTGWLALAFAWWAFVPVRRLARQPGASQHPSPAAAAPGPRARDRL